MNVDCIEICLVLDAEQLWFHTQLQLCGKYENTTLGVNLTITLQLALDRQSCLTLLLCATKNRAMWPDACTQTRPHSTITV